MQVSMSIPDVTDLPTVIETLSSWQEDNLPVQLHPGDIGWHSLRGPEATAADLRVWSVDETILAIGMFDGPHLLRLALSSTVTGDKEFAHVLGNDLIPSPHPGAVFSVGERFIEARGARALDDYLATLGWSPGELWTPLRFDFNTLSTDLDALLDELDLHVEEVRSDAVRDWLVVHRSGFHKTPYKGGELKEAIRRFKAMVSANLVESRHLVAYDSETIIGVVSVWSAGRGRPGLLEPLAIHPEHRGQGYGKQLVTAAMKHLEQMGASSGLVCTNTSNCNAIHAYVSAGFTADRPVPDLVYSVAA